jgi:nitrate reductase gamma subunit
MAALYALIPLGVILIIVLTGIGLGNGQYFFGVILPYAGVTIFVLGFFYRVIKWARIPVPFHIPAVAGQQKSLPWVKNSRIESPSGTAGVIGRMAMEILLFRSLFRNDQAELKRSSKLIYSGRKYLWLGALAFHWSLLIIVLRHLRFFIEPVPTAVTFIQNLDGIFQIMVPTIFITDFVILIALTYLVLRRIVSPQVRYISLMSDYFAIFLIAGIAISGVLVRFFFRVDITSVKEFAMSLLVLNPVIPAGLNLAFYIHFSLVIVLIAYLPFSKIMHAPGVFLSPTRNLANNSRRKRHVNPWDYPVKVHTYEEWEDEYRNQMKKVGLRVEKE